MNSKLSVFETMQEMLRLSAKHLQLLVVVGLIQAAPSMLTALLTLLSDKMGSKFFPLFFVIPLVIITFIIDAACRAAVLGVLAEPAPELKLTAMRTAIRTRTWTLVRVSILLMLIAIPIEMVCGLIALPFMSAKMPGVAAVFTLFFGVIFLVLLKYALADPIVVTQGARARESLGRSWGMTRGHFGYVMLCYFLLGGVLAVIQFGAGKLHEDVALQIVLTLFSALLNTTWIVLAWVMYQRIVEADAQPGDAPPTPTPEVV